MDLHVARGLPDRNPSALGRRVEAIELMEMTLPFLDQLLGAGQLATFRRRTTLAAQYMQVGRHDDGLQLAEETLRLMVSMLGAEHSETLGGRQLPSIQFPSIIDPSDMDAFAMRLLRSFEL